MIVLLGEPRSTQHCYKYTCVGGSPRGYMSADCKALKEDYFWQAKSQWKHPLITEPVSIDVTLYFKTRRTHDIDNYGKLLLDSLTGIVWEDDGQVEEMRVRKTYSKENPRIEINITKYGNREEKHKKE